MGLILFPSEQLILVCQLIFDSFFACRFLIKSSSVEEVDLAFNSLQTAGAESLAEVWN